MYEIDSEKIENIFIAITRSFRVIKGDLVNKEKKQVFSAVKDRNRW